MRNYIPKIFNNERGGMTALLSVVVLSMVVVTSLASVYVYLENRAKFQGRVKASYQVNSAFEELAQVMSDGFLIANSPTYVGTENCPNGMVSRDMAAGSGGEVRICVLTNNLEDPEKGGVCVSGDPTLPGMERVCVSSTNLANVDTDTMVAENSINDFYSRLDKFFDTTVIHGVPKAQVVAWNFLETEFKPPTYLGWLLPEQALATSAEDWKDYHRNTVSQSEQDGGRNFLNLSEDYLRSNLEGGKSGTSSQYPGESVTTSPPGGQPTVLNNPERPEYKLKVGLYTQTCSGSTDNPQRHCFVCGHSTPSNPCFQMNIRNPLASPNCGNNCNYQMAVRVIR